MDKTKKMLSKGYFPSQLPPPFKTASFAAQHFAWASAWPTQYSRVPYTRGEFFSVARAGHIRRPVTIPNPINQYYLASALTSFWPDIQKHFAKSKLSLSKPTLNKSGERATEIVALSELYERRLILSAGHRYVLKTDISRFFPTLYTHSIPWALHTKAIAKRTKSLTATFFGNIVDLLVQRCQHRQTLGIPIGPDTSHVVAEIIACAADVLIREQLGKWPVGYRHVDDYFMCFNSAREAETALAAIIQALRDFELDINVNKTHVVKVEELFEDSWVDPIRSFEFEVDDAHKQRNDIHKFFMTAFDLSRRYADENVMKYALRKSSSVLVKEQNWPIYESYILRTARAHLNTLQTATSILGTYHSLGYNLGKDRIAQLCENIIREAAPFAHHSEVTWSLWLAIELGIKLSKGLCKPLEEMNSGVCALVALHCRSLGVLPSLKPSSTWLDSMDGGGLRDTMWLLAYEASVKGWLPEKSPNFVGADNFFSHLKTAGVSFYAENERLDPLIKKVKKTVPNPAGFGGEVEIEDFEFEDQYDEYVS